MNDAGLFLNLHGIKALGQIIFSCYTQTFAATHVIISQIIFFPFVVVVFIVVPEANGPRQQLVNFQGQGQDF